jgi:hypothetical protein
MIGKEKSKKIRTSMLVLLATMFMICWSDFAFSQPGYNKYLFLPPKEVPITFIDILFELNDSSVLKEKIRYRDETGDRASKKIEQDTSKKENRILSLRDGGDKFFLYLELLDKDQTIDITVYNMLGKEVIDVYHGVPKPNGVPYEINVSGPSSLPNGPYLCVVIGKNFRLKEKFLILRR